MEAAQGGDCDANIIYRGCGLWPPLGTPKLLELRRRKFGHAPLAILAIVISETLVFFLALKKTVGEPC